MVQSRVSHLLLPGVVLLIILVLLVLSLQRVAVEVYGHGETCGGASSFKCLQYDGRDETSRVSSLSSYGAECTLTVMLVVSN